MIIKSTISSCRTSWSLLILFLLLITPSHALRPYHFTSYQGKDTDRMGGQDHMPTKGGHEAELGVELYPTGSSLPDCAHACGACAPCRRVMVSYNKCSVESCPVVYRCMCKGRYYHVPSS